MTVIQCHEVWPSLGTEHSLYMLEVFGASLVLGSRHLQESSQLECLQVELWTNLVTRHNTEGAWHTVELSLVQHQDGVARYEGGVQATSDGAFQFTYRYALKDNPEAWHWLGTPWNNGHITILPPTADMTWTQGPQYAEVWPGVYVGNFIAASAAAELGFDAVLNMAEELTPTFRPEDDISYQKLPCRDGAVHAIAPEVLQQGVDWVNARRAEDRKILIHCRAGIGRSGSIGIAYCFAQNPGWSYQQTLEYVWSKKPDIYPHSQLQSHLEGLFPRQAGS